MTGKCKFARFAARPFVVVVVAALSACSAPRAWEAGLVLGDIAAVTGDSALKRATLRPSRTPLRYAVAGRERAGDVYASGPLTRGAIVLVPGVTPQGKDDPRLVAFAHTLARAGFAVLVPDIGNLRALKVSHTDAEAVADAVRHLSRQVAVRDEAPVGIVAVSYAVGPAILAALDPDAASRVRFVVAIGGYFDIDAVVTFFTTGAYRADDAAPWRYRRPNEYGKWVFAKSNADRIDDLRDQVLLAAMAERKLADLGADIEDLVADLGAEGRAVHELLANRDPVRVRELIAGLPFRIREEMAALDLMRRDLGRLAARLILVHGRDDAIIPFTESERLARAAAHVPVDLYLIDSLAHVELGSPGLWDALTLWRAVNAVLEERDTMPEPASTTLVR